MKHSLLSFLLLLLVNAPGIPPALTARAYSLFDRPKSSEYMVSLPSRSRHQWIDASWLD